MRRYFKLRDDMTSTKRWHLSAVRADDGSEPLLDAGQPYGGPKPVFTEVHHPGRVLEFCLTSFAVPVASGRLARAVSAVAGPDVQCIPLYIPGHSGMVVLNSVRVIRCLDESRSEFLKWTPEDNRPDRLGEYQQVTKLTLLPEAIPPDAHFFRVKDWVIALIVSEEVKKAMERVGCTGAIFTEVTPITH